MTDQQYLNKLIFGEIDQLIPGRGLTSGTAFLSYAKIQQIQQLTHAGFNAKEIATQVGCCERTVKRYRNPLKAPKRKRR
jgi:hypothetical protein